MGIASLGYIVVRGPVREWRQFGTEVLGVQEVPTADPGTVYFRLDERNYRIAVVDGEPGDDALRAVGWEVRREEELDQLVARLRENGHEATENPELAKARRVRRLVSASDPDGTALELYVGQNNDHNRFISPRGVRFLCGELGLGHLFMSTPHPAETAAFYENALGFRLTDTIEVMGTDAIFLHCNPRHHSVAFARTPRPERGLGHLMLEVDTLQDVGTALDTVKESGAPLAMDIGEHANDHMISFYVATPSGFMIEYGWNGRTVDDDTWTVSHYTATSNWGHRMADGTAMPKTSAL